MITQRLLFLNLFIVIPLCCSSFADSAGKYPKDETQQTPLPSLSKSWRETYQVTEPSSPFHLQMQYEMIDKPHPNLEGFELNYFSLIYQVDPQSYLKFTLRNHGTKDPTKYLSQTHLVNIPAMVTTYHTDHPMTEKWILIADWYAEFFPDRQIAQQTGIVFVLGAQLESVYRTENDRWLFGFMFKNRNNIMDSSSSPSNFFSDLNPQSSGSFALLPSVEWRAVNALSLKIWLDLLHFFQSPNYPDLHFAPVWKAIHSDLKFHPSSWFHLTVRLTGVYWPDNTWGYFSSAHLTVTFF
ncbi:MAG: hypothetical protein NZ480_02520 [Bdellovibrionaceae bacterium]|nr:hypothetical protein [Pseudobdellovibrionaceae bacterium]MDW8190821.1 hypothetical protein [Pseudobdellovibrionaceae bacterium]